MTHPCLSNDIVVRNILSRIPVKEQLAAQAVCMQWKNFAADSISQVRQLAISEHVHSWFYASGYCDDHEGELLHSLKHIQDCVVSHPFDDIDYWTKTMKLFSNLEYLYFDLESKNEDEELDYLNKYSKTLEVVMKCCSSTLKCLVMPSHSQFSDFSFPYCDHLPNLRHFTCGRTSASGLKNLIEAAPRLEFLYVSSSLGNWQILPQGFKILKTRGGDVFEGLTSVMESPATATLEEITDITISSEMCFKPFYLPKLHTLSLCIERETNGSLRNLARILTFAPAMKNLTLDIECDDEIDSESWIKVLSNCPAVTHLEIFMNIHDPKINIKDWQDVFAEEMTKTMKKLKSVDIPFHLSSRGLSLLASLEYLESFYHKIYVDNMKYDTVFDTQALVAFLRKSFSKSLRDYYCCIPERFSIGEYLILDESFLQTYKQLEDEFPVRFVVAQEHRHYEQEVEHPERIPGKIYVTKLDARERTKADEEKRQCELFSQEMKEVTPLFEDIIVFTEEEKEKMYDERSKRAQIVLDEETEAICHFFSHFMNSVQKSSLKEV